MRPTRLVLALLIGLVGLVWTGQGLGVIPGSAMSGVAFWALVGVVLIALAIVVVIAERRRTA